MYEYEIAMSKPTSEYPQWYCKKCGQMFYEGFGERVPIALIHDDWHEKLDKLFDNVPIV